MPLTVRGLTSGGYLLATDATGAKFELHPDGNRRAHGMQYMHGGLNMSCFCLPKDTATAVVNFLTCGALHVCMFTCLQLCLLRAANA